MPILRLAVFASGSGTNFQALLDTFNARSDPDARVELLVASRAGIGALDRARKAEIPCKILPSPDRAEKPEETDASFLLGRLAEHRIDLIVLAGYLRLVPPEVVREYHGRIINIHPALLPSFGGPGMYGKRVHKAVLAAGCKVTGATVHWVDEGYDQGHIIAQWPVPVLPGDTSETLAARVLRVEHVLLPAAVRTIAVERPSRPLADPARFTLGKGTVPPTETILFLSRLDHT